MDRKSLTFEQAEGIDPLPTQLGRGEITQEIRARIGRSVVSFLEVHQSYGVLVPPARTVVRDLYVERFETFVSKAPIGFEECREVLERYIGDRPWYEVYGLVQWLCRHGEVPLTVKREMARQLHVARAPYRLVDGDTLFPVTSEEDRRTIVGALQSLRQASANGAARHLKSAGEAASAGDWSGCVRESIHAVESVVKVLNPGATTLGDTLAQLRREGAAHPALCGAFEKLYGFTSDEKGVRHAYLDDPTNSVDEPLALFMLGACSAFCSYLIAKQRD